MSFDKKLGQRSLLVQCGSMMSTSTVLLLFKIYARTLQRVEKF